MAAAATDGVSVEPYPVTGEGDITACRSGVNLSLMDMQHGAACMQLKSSRLRQVSTSTLHGTASCL